MQTEAPAANRKKKVFNMKNMKGMSDGFSCMDVLLVSLLSAYHNRANFDPYRMIQIL
jgi:hypothetical protein